MTRRAFKPTPVAVMLQSASLLAVAAGVFGILANDIIRHRAEIASAEVAVQGAALGIAARWRREPR